MLKILTVYRKVERKKDGKKIYHENINQERKNTLISDFKAEKLPRSERDIK